MYLNHTFISKTHLAVLDWTFSVLFYKKTKKSRVEEIMKIVQYPEQQQRHSSDHLCTTIYMLARGKNSITLEWLTTYFFSKL